jgi:N-glycosylase/DNA lyase
VNLAPFFFDDKRECLSRVERIGESLVTVEVTQQKTGDFVMTVRNAGLAPTELDRLKQRVIRWLSLDWNPKPALGIADRLSKPTADFIRAGGGRFLRGSSFYEDFVKTLATVNASWSFTQKMIGALVNGIGGGAFPLPKQIIKAKVRYLESKVKMGYRSKVLYDATSFLLKEKIIDEEGQADESRTIFEDLIAIKGIGNYAATHIRVLLQDYSRIPIDSEVRPYCASRYGIDDKQIPAFFSPWGNYAFLGYKLTRILDRDNWIG